jgi:hypothetical protein
MDVNKFATTSIRIGNNTNPNNNTVCKDGVNKDGMYACDTPLTGNFVGIQRTG